MHIKIGNFNKMPLYLNIPSPLKLIKQIFSKKQQIAYARFEIKFYDQLKYIYSNPRIIVYPYYLLLPKLKKSFILWHEYGHCISLLHDEEEDKSSFHDVSEAMADFYACCKLKLHFNEYIKIRGFLLRNIFYIKKRNQFRTYLDYEQRYNKLYSTKELPLNKRTSIDHVYEFYKNKNNLIDWYNLCFKEVCDMDSQYYFDWNRFLTEIGWDNDEERWKYIDYKENYQRNIAI